jgi:hypothetical protein
MAGGTFTVGSYDKLKELKRGRKRCGWKIGGTEYPVVDYGQAYINQLSE